MQKAMQLKCTARLNPDTEGYLDVTAQQYDGSDFVLKTLEGNVTLNEPITDDKPLVEGWMDVMTEGEQAGRVAITLPSPSLVHGKNVSVAKHDLLPKNVTLADFGMKTPEQKT